MSNKCVSESPAGNMVHYEVIMVPKPREDEALEYLVKGSLPHQILELQKSSRSIEGLCDEILATLSLPQNQEFLLKEQSRSEFEVLLERWKARRDKISEE